MNISEYRAAGQTLEICLRLHYSPIALKFIQKQEEIPEGYLRPAKDLGGRFCACQAYAMVRRERKKLALLPEDHGCVWFMIGAGIAPFDEKDYSELSSKLFGEGGNLEFNLFIKDRQQAEAFFASTFPKFPKSSNLGIILAPLSDADFEPDVTLLYARPQQLRTLLMAYKFASGKAVGSVFDSVESCLYSTVAAVQAEDCRIVVPDPGEYKRAFCDEDEMIFSVPSCKLEQLCATLQEFEQMGLGYRQMNKDMTPMAADGFYGELLKLWDME